MATETKTRTGGVLAATCLSTLVVNANTSAVSILLPAISEDTGMSVDTLQWAVTGYSLVGAAVIVTSGSLGDVFGRKRIFQLGLAAVRRFLRADRARQHPVAWSSPGACIQGAAGATILACGLSLLSVANTGQAQLRAVSLWGAAAAVGAAAGPLLGGVLVEITGWQGLFWIDAGVAVVCMVLTVCHGDRVARPEPAPLDRLRGDRAGRAHPCAVHTRPEQGQRLGLGVARHARLAWRWPSSQASRSSPWNGGSPSRCWTWRCCATGSWSVPRSPSSSAPAPSTRLMYLVSLYFQDPSTLGFSPLQAGLATLPATVGLVVIAPLVPRLAARFGGRQVDRCRASRSPPPASRRSASSTLLALSWPSCCLWSPSPSGWDCPTGPRRRPRRLQSRPSRSGRPPASPTWPATSARRWRPRWRRRSTPP